MNKSLFLHCLKITSPVFFGYITIGIGFGILFVDAGYPWWLTPVSSLFMFTGAGQYFAVALFAGGATLGEILLVEFLLSIRHIFYGLSLITKYSGAGLRKPYMMFGITDETFALVQTAEVPEGVNKFKFYTLVSLLDQSYWFLGTLAGAVGFSILKRYNLDEYFQGVDFALTSLFVVLLIGQIQATKDWFAAVLGGLASVCAVVLYRFGIFDSSSIIWTAICAGLGVMLLVRGPAFFRLKADFVSGEEKTC